MIPFVRKKALLKFSRPKLNAILLRQIAACGSPVFLSNISGRVTAILMNISLMTVGAKVLGETGGTTAVAVYAVLMYASDLCWPLLYGISDSLSPAIGYNWGAKQYDRVKKIARCGYIGVAVVGLISTAILFFFSETVASWFVKEEDILLLELAGDAIKLFCFAYLFRWFVVMSQSYFSAIEKPLLATIISVATAFVFPILLLGALWYYELDGIWLNFVGVNVLAALLSAVLLGFLSRDIKRKLKRSEDCNS
jgi:Na+-driven multidrug efflux pump